MTRREARLAASAAVPAVLAALLAGCSGGNDAAAAGTSAAPIEVTGTVTFDRVPAAGVALDYNGTLRVPARGVTVEAVSDGVLLGSTTTDADGRYALTVSPAGETLRVRALAEMRRSGTPSWDYRVVDNTRADALYALESGVLSAADIDVTADLHAASGWGGSGYSSTRAAAPFAILDVVRDATDLVVAAEPTIALPPLTLHWSPRNVPSRSSGGGIDFATGEIGSSLYSPGVGIFLLGAADSDTDEYDRHVIAHEWAHYLEHALARSDNIGGPHTRGDQLDMRTAFSEGFANAFAAMVLGDTRYVDVLGPGQAQGFTFDIEGPFHGGFANPHPGWFSEESVQEIVYDLFDAEQDVDDADDLALGVKPILDVLTGDLRTGAALTSIFAFADGLRARAPEHRTAIDALLAAQQIGPFADAYGADEANAGVPLEPTAVAPGDILPVYKPLEVGGSVELCSTDAYTYEGQTGYANKLGIRAFAKLEAESAGTYVFEAVTTVLPPGEAADPDMILHGAGLLHWSDGRPDEALCTAQTPEGCTERFERFLGPGHYVLEVYEWTNTQTADAEHPPIGRTCFDVTVSVR